MDELFDPEKHVPQESSDAHSSTNDVLIEKYTP